MTSDTRQDAISRRVAILVTFWQIGWNWNDSCFFHDSFCFFCKVIILREITLRKFLWTFSFNTKSRKIQTKLVKSNFVSFSLSIFTENSTFLLRVCFCFVMKLKVLQDYLCLWERISGVFTKILVIFRAISFENESFRFLSFSNNQQRYKILELFCALHWGIFTIFLPNWWFNRQLVCFCFSVLYKNLKSEKCESKTKIKIQEFT